jgi:hypothetical protein
MRTLKTEFFVSAKMARPPLRLGSVLTQTSSVTTDVLHNLRILLAVHACARPEPNTVQDLMRRITQRYATFLSTTRFSADFVRLYDELRDGYRAVIELPEASQIVHIAGNASPNVAYGRTPHGVPCRVHILVRMMDLFDPVPYIVPQSQTREDWVIHREIVNIITKSYIEEYSEEYQRLVKNLTNQTIARSKPITPPEVGVGDAVNSARGAVSSEVQRHIKDVFELTDYYVVYNHRHHQRPTSAVPKFKKDGWRYLETTYTNNDLIHQHFAYIAATRDVTPMEEGAVISIDDIIDVELPGETDVEKEIRRDLRAAAHAKPEPRYLLAMLHVAHPDSNVVQRGMLLMKSAAADGSARAATYLSRATASAPDMEGTSEGIGEDAHGVM